MEQFAVAPPPVAWDNIAAQLPKKKSRSLFWVYSLAGAASVALLTGIFFLNNYFTSVESVTELASTNVSVVPDSFGEPLVPRSNLELVAKADVVSTDQPNQPSEAGAAVVLKETPPMVKSFLQVARFKGIGFRLPAMSEPTRLIALAAVLTDTDFSGLADTLKKQTSAFDKSAYTRMLLADAQPVSSKSKDNFKRFELAGVANSSYSALASSNTSLRTLESTEKGTLNAGGGLALKIHTSSKWSFETGVHYGRIGQKEVATGSQPIVLTASDAQGVLGGMEGHRNSMGQLVVTAGSNAVAGKELIGTSTIPVRGFAGDVLQNLDYVEIPFLARYRVWNHSHWDVLVSAGLSANILADNNAYVINGGSKSRVGYTESIDPFALSTSVGMSLEVPIYKSLSFSLEPRMKYFVTSLNESYNYQPYSFTVFAGLGISF